MFYYELSYFAVSSSLIVFKARAIFYSGIFLVLFIIIAFGEL